MKRKTALKLLKKNEGKMVKAKLWGKLDPTKGLGKSWIKWTAVALKEEP